MKKNNEKKYLHLTYKDRSVIHEFLNYGYSFTDIGKRIHKDKTLSLKRLKHIALLSLGVRLKKSVVLSLIKLPTFAMPVLI